MYSKQEILEDIRSGVPLIITDDESRENEGDFFVSARCLNHESLLLMLNEGRGLICAPMSSSTASKLKLSLMVNENSSNHSTAFTVSVDHKNNSTGISARDRLETLKALADVDSIAEDFVRPGHIFPLIADEGGLFARRGHTEAAVELSKLAGVGDVGVICEILNKDGSVAKKKDLDLLSLRYSLKIITVDQIVNMFLCDMHTTNLPTKYGIFKFGVIKVDGEEVKVLWKGDLNESIPTIRVHSSCVTGDVFGSLRCDCGDQLEYSMKYISEKSCGMIIYLEQEGRGIGIVNKIQAYNLQDKGLDTYEANQSLGFKDDLRSFEKACVVLKKFGLKKINLITNNPDKISEIINSGIEIKEVVNATSKINEHNFKYLMTKKNKKHHQIKKERFL
ncbi:MAG: 3,4-dihydroxy-2-butanone-4-phosphate synthase [Halobacteriovoraceae bacterium]|nr:3,4-dihydroxy-2-butanone-4-phosphate synthase [Halobacteriovoraceae bacterium]